MTKKHRTHIAYVYMTKLGEYEWEGQRLSWGRIMDILHELYPSGYQIEVKRKEDQQKLKRRHGAA